MSWKNDFQAVIGSLARAALTTISRARLPQTEGALRLDGLTKPVEVLRDRWGVPHIYALNEADALFAQGFVHAQERLWQMDFTRRLISGRLAEVIGAAALPFDRAIRTLGFRRIAEQEAGRLSEPVQSLTTAYCAGINAWLDIAKVCHKLPVEFMLLGYTPEPWQTVDSLCWGKLMDWTLAGNWESEFLRGQIVQRLGAEKAAELEIDAGQAWAVILDAGLAMTGGQGIDPTRTFSGPRAGEGVGSNNWVVDGSRTFSGKPLLANDMHLGLTLPAAWFENHVTGGGLDISGITFPGVPLVVSGHNRHVAWGYTDGFADVQDLYEEHLRRSDSNGWEVEYQGTWCPAEVRREEIRVKGGADAVEEVVVTRHGPIINILFRDAFPDAPPLALRWTALEPEETFLALFELNGARSCQEFHTALRRFDGPAQNTVYADTQGNIAYSLTGKIPIRGSGDGSVPSQGWTGAGEWVGTIPFEKMPHLINPSRGFVATANNQLNRPDSLYYIGRDFVQADRAARIVELLEVASKVDVPYIKQMHFDQVSISARVLAGYLGRLEVGEPELQELVGQMQDWDGRLDADSPLAAVYQVTMRKAIRMVLERHLGDLGVRVQGKKPASGLWDQHAWEWFIHLLEKPTSPWFDLGQGERRDDVLRMALRQAVDFLKQELGTEMKNWRWGALHQLIFRHVLGRQKPLDRVFNRGPYPVGGDGSTIWATYTSMHDLSNNEMVAAPFRFIADLNDLDHCWGLLAPGQSGHLASKHLADGVDAWFKAGYHPMHFTRSEVEKDLESRLVLSPAVVK